MSNPELDVALARYGLTAAEVPRDHEGKSIDERWADLIEATTLPPLPTADEDANDQLGNPDFGRLRGGPWLVWWDPELDRHDDRQAADAADVDPEDAKARGLILLAQVHTRNGGGNRDCYCDDANVHEDGCLAVRIHALQNHPAYYGDWDDDFDFTYADFFFRVDEERSLAALAQDAESRRRHTAGELRDNIVAGGRVPWAVFPYNPAIVRLIEDLSAQAASVRADVRTASGARALRDVRPRYGGSITAKHAADVDALIAYLDGETTTAPAMTASWGSTTPESQTKRAREVFDGVGALVKRRDAVLAHLPEAPAGVRAVLEEAIVRYPYDGCDDRLVRAVEAKTKQMNALHKLRDALVKPVELAQKERELVARIEALRTVLTWPGDPDMALAALKADAA